MNRTELLQEINSTLFASNSFKEHCPLASNTGIVPVFLLHRCFPQYDCEVLVAMLTSLQLWHPMQLVVLANITTNLLPEFDPCEQLLYFPAVVSVECPQSPAISEGFG